MSGAYDERLLASAPVATRAEKQARYNIDLLDEHRSAAPRSVSHTPPPVPVLAANHAKAEEGPNAGGYAYRSHSAPLPWYKTRKWILIMAVGVVVVIAAVVGGAVGGTVGRNKNNSAVATESGGGGGAVGPAVSEAQDSPGQAASRTTDIQTATTTGNAGGDLASAASSTTTANADPGSSGGDPHES
ncbi:hypothetical protein BC628DRAFT_1416389 [Trametes gibbosa]|nr:hypothetical protein BC628DRAFT_1416389 [Trametes gibbosa]